MGSTPEPAQFQLYLAVENIDHLMTKTKSSRTNRFCERFHRTILKEFNQIAFRKKIHRNLDELQTGLDAWLVKYHQERPYNGRYCYGKTPMETFKDSLPSAQDKMLDTWHDKALLTVM